jgi:hypothetical protein
MNVTPVAHALVRPYSKEIAISKFKATCLAVLEDVRRTRRPVRVTRLASPWPR